MLVGKTDFELNLEVASNDETPKPKREIWKLKDAWKLSGLIEGDLEFASSCVSPSGKHLSSKFGKKTTYIQKLRLENIELIPEGFDALSAAKRNKILGRHAIKKPKFPKVEFHAVLFGCEPVFLNAGTRTKTDNDFLGTSGGSALDTFIGRGRDYDFGLIKKEEGTHVHFRSKSHFRSLSIEDDWRRFYALLFAVGFTHGFQPWPYRVEYWRGGRKINDKFRVPQSLTKTVHTPFDKAIGFIGNFRRKGSKDSVVRLAAKFFEKQNPISKGLSRLLFLFREAGSSAVFFDIRTLALCSLFEGTIDLIFHELKLKDDFRRTNSQFDEYLKLRARLVNRLRKLSSGKQNSPLGRLVGSLNSAKEFRTKDKFQAICEHFHLDYEKEMKQHIKAWEKKRHSLMHGTWEAHDSDFSDQALIAGAINILVLKVMGYSGRMKFNAFANEQNKYRTI